MMHSDLASTLSYFINLVLAAGMISLSVALAAALQRRTTQYRSLTILFSIFFASAALGSLELGADALLYVMAHGHTLSVPTHALRFAEKVGVIISRSGDKDMKDCLSACLRRAG